MPYSINSGQRNTLHWEDYVIFAGTLLVSASVGLYHAIKGRKKNSARDFHMGNRQMHTIPVALSVSVTFLSALTLLGMPAEVYVYDTMLWWMASSLVFAVGGAAHIFIPILYKLGVMSTYQLLYQAFVLFAPSLALNAVTGLDLWLSVCTVGIIVTLYTSLGGMKTVLWTDSLQSFIILVGLTSLLVMGAQAVGGFSTAWEVANNRGRIRFFDFNPNPGVRHSFWSVVVGGSIYWVSKLGVNQNQVQRLLSCPSLKKAQVALWLSCIGMVTIVMACNLIGILLHAFYKDCNPIDFEGLISSLDQLAPLFAMDIFHNTTCLPGVFLACIFSGSLSTLSSALNALSAVVLEDYIVVYCCPSMSEVRSIIISRSLVLLFGALSMAFAYVISNIGNIMQMCITVESIMDGPLFGLFILGMFCPCANTAGAAIGYMVSLIFMLWVGIGAYLNGVSTPKSTTYTDGCNWNISTGNYSVSNSNISNFNTSIQIPEDVLPENTVETRRLSSSGKVWKDRSLQNFQRRLSRTIFPKLSRPGKVMCFSDVVIAVVTSLIQEKHTAFPALKRNYLSLYDLSYFHYTSAGMGVTVVVGVIVSYITRLCVKSPPVSTKLSRSPLDIISSWIPGRKQGPDPEQENEERDKTRTDSPFLHSGNTTATSVRGASPSQKLMEESAA